MSILSDELANDPNVAGYSTMTDIEAATTLNLPGISINRTTMSGSELLDNTDSTEYSSLTNVKRDQWLSLCGVDSIDPFGSVVQIVVNIWGGGSQTITNLQAARVELISRTQEIGIGLVNEGDVNMARA